MRLILTIAAIAAALIVCSTTAAAGDCKRKAFPWYGECWSRFEGPKFTKQLRAHGVDPHVFARNWPQLARVFRKPWPGPKPWSDAWLTERTPNRSQLMALANCETGVNWQHYNSTYAGALGFLHSTWSYYAPSQFPRPASAASPAQQLYVGQILINTFHGYSSWPACSIRLGLR